MMPEIGKQTLVNRRTNKIFENYYYEHNFSKDT